MSLSKKTLSFAALCALSCFAQAQTWNYGGLLQGNVILVPPSLPSVQSRIGNYDRTIGNTWLGGSVHAFASMVRQKSGTYELGSLTGEFRATANVLKVSKEVAEVFANATNVMNNGVQSRSGLYRVEVLGYTVSSGSVVSNSTFAASSSTYNLFPVPIQASVPVGPVSLTLRGNAGCGFGRSANFLLPAATASVGLNASYNAYAFANASVSFGIPGFNVGVGIQGKILEQTLAGNINASAVWGLSGGITYTLKAITLQLYAWATALYTWTTNLCAWSAGLVSVNIL